MDITQARKILDALPDRTDYEFKNLELEALGSWHRQVRYVLAQYESLTDQIDGLDADIHIMANEAAADKYSKRKLQSQINAKRRQMRQLRQRLSQLQEWLDSYSDDELAAVPNTFEGSESDHWSESLGRTMGADLLSDSHVHNDTMMRLSLLPLPDYRKAVLISNQFATFIKRTTEEVERSFTQQQTKNLPAEK